MIKEKAKELLELLKQGKGSTNIFGNNYYDEETRKIIEVITNECKGTVIDKDGQKKRYESDLTINAVRETVEQLLSDKNSIKSSLALQIMRVGTIPGLVKEIKVNKKVNEKGLPYLEIDKPFPEDFESILTGSKNREDLVKQIIKPYVAKLCKQTPELSKKHFFTRILNPFNRREATDKQLEERYSKYLKDNTNLDEEKIQNMSTYFIKHLLGNKEIKERLINYEINGTSMQVFGEKNKIGYEGMLQNISNNLLDTLTTIENPNNKLKELENIYANLTGQLEAISTEFEKDPTQIEETIKNINITINRDRQEYYSEIGYRNVDVGFDNKESGLLKKEHVPDAMKLYAESINDFLENSENMPEEEYIKQVAKLQMRFIRIHPFPDGNGRTGRAISNMLLSKRNLCAVFNKATKGEYTRQMTHLNNIPIYNKGLYTDQSICEEIEEKDIYKLEEYIGMQCLNKPELYSDRNITKELTIVEDKER